MKRIALAAALAALSGGAFAQEAGELEGVITEQMSAFLADDFATAFTYASPMIRSMFGNPGNFGAMVRDGYPMVWRPADIRFEDQRPGRRPGEVVQRLSLRGPDGSYYICDYTMVETPAGWKINGVQILPAPGVGA